MYYIIAMKVKKGHTIYSNLTEATQHNRLDVKRDWRKAKAGDWVISDCGMVLELLKVSRSFVDTAAGQYMLRSRKGMHIDKTNEPKSNPKKMYLNIRQKEFVRQYTIFFDINKAYALVYSTKNKNWRRGAKNVFTQPKVQTAIENRITGMLKDLNIDDKFFITNLKRMIGEGNKPNQLEALKELRGYIENILGAKQDRDNLLKELDGKIEDASFVVHGEDNGKNNRLPDAASVEEPTEEDNTS